MNGWMTWMIVLGGIGFGLLVPWVIELRVSLGREAKGLIGIIIDALLSLIVLLTFLYAAQLMRGLGFFRDAPSADALRILTVTLFMVLPWWILIRLFRWRISEIRGTDTMGATATRTIANGQAKPPDTMPGGRRKTDPPVNGDGHDA